MKKIVLIALVLFLASSLFAGLEWTMKMENVAKQKKQSYSMVLQYFAQGGNVKQVTLETSKKKDDLYNRDVYWIYRVRENTLYVVNDKEKNYYEMPLDYIFRMMSAFGGFVKIKVSDVAHKVERLPNETVNGYSCEHYKVEMKYLMEVKIAIIKKKMNIRSEREIWSTRKISFSEIGEGFRFKDLKTGIEDLDKLIEKERELHQNLGFIVKRVETTYETNKKGVESQTAVLTTELVDLKPASLSPDTFAIPAGYEKVEMPGQFGEQ